MMLKAFKELFYTVPPEKQHPPDLGMLRLLGIVRIVYAYCMLHTVTFGHVLFAPLYYPGSFWMPVSLSFLLGGPPDAAVVHWGNILAITSTVLLGLGLFTRWMGPLCFVTCTLMLCISFSFGRLNHNTNTVPLLLLVFSFTDWGYCYSLDALIRKWTHKPAKLLRTVYSDWFVWLTLATFSLPYFTTGMFKLMRGYFMESGYISALIRYKQLFWEQHLNSHVPAIPTAIRHIQEFVIAHPLLSDSFIWGTLFIEIFFFLSLMSKTSRMFMLALALILHSSITLTTKVYFLEHMFMVALLLAITLILHFRKKPGFMGDFFDAIPLPESIVDRSQPPVWKKTAWAYVACFAFVFALIRLPLPVIDFNTWNKLHILHAGYKFFPTDTYLFWYTNDQIIGGVFWIFSFTVLTWLIFGYVSRVIHTVFLESPVKDACKRILIYDGDCGFCQKWVNWAITQDGNKYVEFTPYQRSLELLEKTGLTAEECNRYAIYVELDNVGHVIEIQKAAGSINAVFRHLPGTQNMFFRLLGMLYVLDGVKQLEEIGYKIIARNRHRLGSPACQV